jgi:cytochrome oxidase Cu insertion factor (SCO1/SenC/PrrC family)
MSRAVLFWLATLLFVCGGTLIWLGVKNADRFTAVGGTNKPATPAAYKIPKDESKWLTEYQLTERSGRKIGTNQLQGQIHVVSFFFASCKGTCRTQNHNLGGLEREFRKDGVKFIAITCDPETDDTARLREYASEFQAPEDSWYFLTGDLTYTKRVAGEIYGVMLDRQTHIERFLLVDRKGKKRGSYSWADAKQLAELRQDIRTLLADNDAQTSAEIREEQRKAEEEKQREEEEQEDA